MDTKERMILYAKELQGLLNSGKTLRDISRLTYDRRQSGENIPYMAVYDMSNDHRILELYAAPTSKQTELKKFFEIKRNDSNVFSRFTLRIKLTTGVEFYEKPEKTQLINLLTSNE